MRVRLIDNTEDFSKLQRYWNDVLEKSSADFLFMTFEWSSSWWGSFGRDKHLFVLAANKRDEGTPVGMAPLMLKKSVGFGIIKFI